MIDNSTILTNIIKDTSNTKEKLPKDWNELCEMYKNKYKENIGIIEKYTRPGFDGKQCIFIQTLKSGEGIFFVENGYLIESKYNEIIVMLNIQQMWLTILQFKEAKRI